VVVRASGVAVRSNNLLKRMLLNLWPDGEIDVEADLSSLRLMKMR
jgi:hypothetical protein